MKKYYLTDIESGFKYEVTKEQWESYQKIWYQVMPKVSGVKGKAMVFGTGGDFSNLGEMFKIFHDASVKSNDSCPKDQ